MKTPILLSLLASLGPCAALADAPATPPPADYVLFLGTDLSIGTKAGVVPVVDINGPDWVVRSGGAEVVIKASDGPVALKRRTAMRLSDVQANVASMKVEQAYTPGNDPYTKFTKASSQAAADFAQSQFAANEANGMMDMATAAADRTNSASPSSAPVTAGSSTSAVSLGLSNAGAQVDAANAAAGATPGALVGTGKNLDDESFDALDVSFELSSKRLLDRPYLVAITRYSERGAPAGAYRESIYARALNPVGSEAHKVRIQQAGFPSGYKLLSFEIHVYNAGREVPTNLSPKREEMARDQAFGYLRRTFAASHKGATLPAAAIMGRLPADLPGRIAKGQYAQPLYVSVGADGSTRGVFLDDACTKPVSDPYLDSLLAAVCFRPALRNGEPVDGVVTLKLAALGI